MEPAAGVGVTAPAGVAGAAAPRPDEVRVELGRPWFPALDGVRGVAALMVVVFHVASFVAPFREWTGGAVLVRLGNAGVALFFVLSGFLLSQPFFTAHLAGDRRPDLGHYAVRRVARIVPAYWVALSVWLFVIRDNPPTGGARAYPILYGFAQGYFRDYVDKGGAISVAWTISIEMAFYIVLPGLAWVLCRMARTGSTVRRTAVLAWGCVGLWVVGTLVRWWMLEQGDVWALRAYSLLGHIGWFGAGMALAAVVAGATVGVRPPRWLRDVASAPWFCVGLAVGLLALTTLLPIPPPGYPQRPHEAAWVFVGNGLFGALCILPFVIGDQTRGTLRAGLSSPPARWLGVISYGLYLWHTLVLHVVREWTEDGAAPRSFWWVFVLVLVPSLALGQLSWSLVERPTMRWANRLVARR